MSSQNTITFKISSSTYNNFKNLRNPFVFLNLKLKALLFLTLILVPVSFWIYSIEDYGSVEDSLFFLLSVATVILSGVYLILIALFGRSVLIDPKGFMIILFSGLLLTTSSVLLDSGDTASTFGLERFRVLSGITTISLLILFYLVAYARSGRYILTALGLGGVLFLISLFSDDVIGSEVALGFVFSLIFLMLVNLRGKFLFFWIIAASVMLIKILSVEISDEISFILLFVGGASGLIALAPHLLNRTFMIEKFDSLRINFKELRKDIKSKGKLDLLRTYDVFAGAANFVFLILPVVFLVSSFLVLNGEALETFVDDRLQSLKDPVNLLLDSDERTDILFGVGLSENSTGAIATGGSFVSILTESFGLFGLASFALLWGYAFYLGFTTVLNSIRSKSENINVYTLLLSYLVALPVLSVFIYPGLIFFVVWIILFGIIASSYTPLRDMKPRKIEHLKFRGIDYGPKSIFFRRFISLLIFIGAIILLVGLYDLRGEIF